MQSPSQRTSAIPVFRPAALRFFRNTVCVRTSEGGSRAQALPSTPDSQTPQIGDILDSRYLITGILGSGGMGCVYLAEHVSIRRPLALKLLHPEVGDIDEVTKRFEREAFAIGRVDHPNCVTVSDFGKLDSGTFYMVLELLDGVLLSDLLEREQRVEWKRALHIGRHVLSALSSAHQAGIVHRDVKPENVILVNQDGDPDFAKILDFGIAKLHDDAHPDTATGLLTNDNKLTQQGVTIGTPTYISPEQAYGLSIDGRADLYSLSVMLFEMITGVPPFDADQVGTLLRMHVSSEVPRFSEVAPELDVPDAVEQLILGGLQKKPEDRIASAEEYIALIDAVLPVAKEAAPSPREVRLPVVDGLRGSLASFVATASARLGSFNRWVLGAALAVGIVAVLAFSFGGSDASDFEMHVNGSEVQSLTQLALGHAHAREGRSREALATYQAAVILDPRLAKDKHMRANVERMLKNESVRVVDSAIDFLGMLVSRADDGAAAQQLIDLASSSKVPRRRHRALRVAEEIGLGDQVDRFGSYVLDLRQGKTCEDRRGAVVKLRNLHDKRAIPHLKEARKRMRPDPNGSRRKVNANACLRGDAAEAIRYLQSV